MIVTRLLALVSLVIILLAALPVVAEDVYVNGYTRKDGTYVPPHFRSAPDGNPNNNWSTYPNVNPYTGQQGTRHPELYQGNGLSGTDPSNGLSGQRRQWR